MKRFFTLISTIILTLSLLSPSASAYAATQPMVYVAINNEILAYPQNAQPFVDENGNVLIPLFLTAEKLGASVKWNESDVVIKYLSDTIVISWLPNGDDTMITINDKEILTDITPILKNNRTYVPLEFLYKLMHCQTTWDNRVRTAFVSSPGHSKGDTALAEQTMTTSEVLKIKSFDGYILSGKLDLPINASDISTLVIFVPGTGPNTYDNHRLVGDKEFNYYDLFAQELGKKQVGFFRYNTRGVDIGDQPPMYDSINMNEYKKYTPENQAKDIEIMITELKKNEKLKNAKIVLLGWSEGTMIAPLVAERNNVEISSLMLAGYCNEKMQDIIEWQLSGDSSMIFYCRYFDTDFDGVISKQEFEEDPYGLVKTTLGSVSFEQMDVNKDNKLTNEDFAILLENQKNQVLDAISKGDEEWLWNNYSRITSEWLAGHAQLEANKDRLLSLNIPINIFHGVYDQNVPLQGVYDIFASYREKGKTNMKVFVFDQHDHDLNYLIYPFNNVISDGLTRIFDECAKVK